MLKFERRQEEIEWNISLNLLSFYLLSTTVLPHGQAGVAQSQLHTFTHTHTRWLSWDTDHIRTEILAKMDSSQFEDRSPFDLLPDEILLRIISMALGLPIRRKPKNPKRSVVDPGMDRLVRVISNISERCSNSDSKTNSLTRLMAT